MVFGTARRVSPAVAGGRAALAGGDGSIAPAGPLDGPGQPVRLAVTSEPAIPGHDAEPDLTIAPSQRRSHRFPRLSDERISSAESHLTHLFETVPRRGKPLLHPPAATRTAELVTRPGRPGVGWSGLGPLLCGQRSRLRSTRGSVDPRLACARRSDRPTHRRASLRASVSSDRSAQRDSRFRVST